MSSEIKPYKWPHRICVECGNRFRSRANLKCFKCRQTIKDRICVECGNQFRSRTDLKCLKCRRSITDRICVECGNRFRSRTNLKCDKCRQTIKDRICVECGNRFGSRTNLKCNKCRLPITDRICVECGNRFRSRTNLKCDKCRRSITDRICVECGNRFRSRTDLKCGQCSGRGAKRRARKLNQDCGCVEYLIPVKQFLCVYCFKVNATDWEHIIPLARDGLHCWNNLVPACSTCNSKKGTKLLSELGWAFKYEPNLPMCTTKLG